MLAWSRAPTRLCHVQKARLELTNKKNARACCQADGTHNEPPVELRAEPGNTRRERRQRGRTHDADMPSSLYSEFSERGEQGELVAQARSRNYIRLALDSRVFCEYSPGPISPENGGGSPKIFGLSFSNTDAAAAMFPNCAARVSRVASSYATGQWAEGSTPASGRLAGRQLDISAARTSNSHRL